MEKRQRQEQKQIPPPSTTLRVRNDNKKTTVARSGGAETLGGAGLCFGGLFFAALWLGGSFE
jgi:hypothetical protein